MRWRERRHLLVLEVLESRHLLSAQTWEAWGEVPPTAPDAHYAAAGRRVGLHAAAQEYAIRISGSDAGGTWGRLTAADGPLRDARLVEQVTGDVYLVDGQGRDLTRLRDEGVAWVTPSFVSEATGERVLVLDEAVVALRPGVAPQEVFAPAGVDYRPLAGTPDQFVVTLAQGGQATLDYAERLSDDPRVAWATPNLYQNMRRMFTPDDPLFPNQWHLNNTGSNSGVAGALAGADVKAVSAWNLGTGAGVTIAVLDDGIERTHPDLAGNIFVNPGEVAGNGIDDDANGWIDDVSGWSFATGGPNPSVGSNDVHGVSVAGIAAASGDNNLGVAGAAFNAKILPVQMFAGNSYVGDAATASAVYYAAGRTATGLGTWNAAQVINCSWGGGSPSSTLTAAFTWASNTARGGLGVATFIASGNDSTNSVSYPASLSASLSGVMAVGASNDIDVRSSYSNYGSALDFVAPSSDADRRSGLGTTTTDRTGTSGYNPANSPAGDYTTNQGATGFGGTSSASPLAAGVGALLVSARSSLTAAQVKQILRATADKVGGVTYDANGFHQLYGYGRINAFAALQWLGMRAIATLPAAAATLAAPPALVGGYRVDFTDPFSTSAGDIVAGGFKVNGVAASSYTVVDADTLQFNFAVEPVTAQGLQSLTIDAGTVKRASDGDAVDAYSSTFRYDVTVLQVTATVPPASGVFILPTPLTFDVQFSEPIAPASVSAGDLNLAGIAGASVGSATVLPGDTTVRFALEGMTSEGTLAASIAAGAITDVYGNPNAIFSGSYTVDVGTAAFPPLAGRNPLGSLVYQNTRAGQVNSAGDTDNYTLALDAGQSLTVGLVPASGLQPVLTVTDPDSNLLGTATAAVAGQEVLLQTLAVNTAGTYTLTVASAVGTSGAYTLWVELNAAVEAESHGGAGNDDFASAQSLDSAFLPLGAAGQRAAVVGVTDAARTTFLTWDMNADPGWTYEGQWAWGQPAGSGGDPSSGYTGSNVLGYNLNGEYAAYMPAYYATTPPFSTLDRTAVQLSFRRWLRVAYDDMASVEVSRDGTAWTSVWTNNGSNIFDSAWSLQTYDISAVADNQPQVFLRFGLGPTNGTWEFGGWNLDDVSLTAAATYDHYALTLAAGQAATIGLSSLGTDTNTLRLYDAGANLLAAGTSSTNVPHVIHNFVAPAAGTYTLCVTGTGVAYNLLVTKELGFDAEANDSLTAAQNLQGSGAALGYLSGTSDAGDYYRFAVNAGDALTLTTQTPADGPNQFANALNPQLELYDPSGTLVASDDDGAADGRNALLSHTAAAAGPYVVRVRASAGAGEYALAMQGATGGLPPFGVSSTTPADGAFLSSAPSTLTVVFDDHVLLTSLQNADLLIDGVPNSSATAPVVADGQTVVFTLPPELGQGTHTVAFAAGALADVQATPLAAYDGAFIIDSTPPRVIASSVLENDVVAPGAWTYTATFDEELNTTVVGTSDFLLTGALSGLRSPSGFSWTDARTLQVQYTGLPEDDYTLTLRSVSGGFQDRAGNLLDGEPHTPFSLPSGDGAAGGDFVVHFAADVATSAFPVPLTAKNPLGSLVYDGSVGGFVNSGTDSDSFTLALDAGQSLTAFVVPLGGLQPVVTVTDPGNGVLGTATAAGVGRQAVVQTVPVSTAGTYTVTVASAAGHTGRYSLWVELNAAVESESHGGAINDGFASAQSLDSAFTALGATGQRAAVLGVTDTAFLTWNMDTDPGWTFEGQWAWGQPTGNSGDPTAGYTGSKVVGYNLGGEYANDMPAYYATTPAFSTLGKTAIQLSFRRWLQVDGRPEDNATIDISLDGTTWTSVWANGSSPIYEYSWSLQTYDISAVADNQPQVFLRFGMGPTDDWWTECGWNIDDVSLIAAPTPDHYSLTLAAGQAATVGLTSLAADTTTLGLYDAGTNLLAAGIGSTSVNRIINDFVAPAAGTYEIRVTGTGVPYNLLVTKDLAFDTEPNDTVSAARELAAGREALGYLYAVDTGDYYRFSVNAGDALTLSTSTPCDGPGEFANVLNPKLELYEPGGSLVAGNDDGAADGRNALLNHTVAATGQYTVRVSPSAGAGEYVLAIQGATGGLPAFSVSATTPANGASLIAAPNTFTVVFNDQLLLTSLQNGDLLIDGVPNASATEPSVTDARTVVFTLPAGLGPGTHTLAFAAGALVDLQNTPLSAYTGTFVIDNTAPNVTASSVVEDDVLAPGALTYTATFDTDMKTTVLDLTDFSLVGAVTGARTPTSYNWTDARNVRLQYATLVEDSYTLTLRSGTDRFQDQAGNLLDGEPHTPFSLPSGDGTAGGDFFVHFTVDITTAAGPLLTAKNPLGSLVYEGSTSATVNSVGDSDSFTIALDAGQSLTALVIPAAGLQPVLSVTDPGGNLLGTTTAGAAGQRAVVQTVAVSSAGTYALTVASAEGTSGTYALQIELNATVEAEAHGGAGNDDWALAQSLEAGFVPLGAGGQRAAVLGVTDAGTTFLAWNMDTDPGWTYQGQWAWGQPSGSWGDPSAGYTGSKVVGYNLSGLYPNNMPAYYATTPAFSTLGQTAVRLSFRRWLRVAFDDVASVEVSRDGSTWTSVWTNGGTNLFETAWSLQTYDISAVADNQPQVFLRFGLGPTNGTNNFGGWNIDDVSLAGAVTSDYYSMTLAAGQAATAGLTSLATDAATLGLYDAGGNLLATGASSTNVNRIIHSFVAPEAGRYDLRVLGANAAYNLVVTKDLGFDAEPNDTFATALDIARPRSALGYLSGTGDTGDYYRFSVNAGDTLTISTATPADGPNQFANTLNPKLELYDPSGALLTSNDNGAADGRNALLAYTAAATGQYVVRVRSSANAGEYLLAIQGATGSLPAFTVSSTTPANGASVLTAPSTYTVAFNDQLLLTSVQNADLLIDGVPHGSAVAPSFPDGKTVVFTLPAGLEQGPHTVAFAAGTMLDLQNTPLSAYNGTFAIDTTPPRVTGSSVAENDIVAPGGVWTYTATFDEDMNTSVLDATDFSLVGARYGARTASSYIWTDARTLQLQYTNLPEDDYTLTLQSAANRFQDRAGNLLDGEPHTPFALPSGDGTAGGDFVVHFVADVVTAAFPLPLTPTNTPGSLVYEGSTAGVVNRLSDSDSFTLPLDAGQSLTVFLVPTGELQPALSVTDPNNSTLGTVAANAAGQELVLQTLPVSTAGTYTLTVAAAAGTGGYFSLQVKLNAAAEVEAHGGAANDDLAAAQSLDSAFLPLGSGGHRAAVLGVTDPRVTFLSWNMDTDPGWTYQGQWAWGQPTGSGGDPTSGYTGSKVVGYNLSGQYANNIPAYYATTPAFSTLGQTGVQLSFRRWLGVDGSTYDRASIHVSRDGTAWTSVWANGTSSIIDGGWTLQTYDLSAVADNQPQVFLRFGMGPTNSSLTLCGWNIDDVSLAAVGPTADYYSVTLAAGQAATVGLTSLLPDTTTLSVYDAGENLLAAGTGSANVHRIINNFVAPAVGTYGIRVTGGNTAYNLFVTKELGFDTEANDSWAAAQDLAGTANVLGYLSGTADAGDYYRFLVQAGDTLTLSTFTPADGPNEFTNTLNPMLELYDPAGTLVVSNDDGAADGRNALLNHTAAASGPCVVRVRAAANSGTYALAIQGATGSLPAFSVAATTPANDAFVMTAPGTLAVVFNDHVLLTSVQNTDLLIDGVPNSSGTAPSFPDGKTVVFTLPAGLGAGAHTVAFAAEALADVQNTPLSAYDGAFVIDSTPPRVTSSSTAENDVLTPGAWTYTAKFDEDMDTALLDAADFSLAGVVFGSQTAGGFSWLDARTLQLQYAALPEDNYTLTLQSATGRFQDRAGNTLDGEPHTPFSLPSGDGAAGGNFVVHFTVDVGTAAFPVPLTAKNPLGSLVYEGSTGGAVNAADDSDRFTIALDAGQSLTAFVVPAGGLQPTLSVTDPGSSPLGSATAGAAGQQVVLQTLAVTAAGTYTLTVASTAGTSGGYTLQVELNAAVEAEAHGGAGNDDFASAQSLDAAFVELGATGQRAAVLGVTDTTRQTFLSWNMDADPGWTFQGQWAWGQPTGSGGDPSSGYNGSKVVGYNLSGQYANSIPAYYATTPAFSTLGQSAVQVSFRRWLGVDVNVFDKATLDVSRNGTTWTSIWANGTSLINETAWSLQTYDISAVADNQPQVFLRFGMGPTSAAFTYCGWNIDDVSLTGVSASDHYALSLAAGQAATIGLTSLAAEAATLQVYDAAENLLAAGTGSSNVQRIINDFVAPADGTYDIRVKGTGAGAVYNLVVTKDLGFDTEANDSPSAAQELAVANGALGYLSGTGDAGDYYRFSVNAGDALTLSTSTPADGPNQFANTLNPRLELYDPAGALVAGDDDGAVDGRNALLSYTAGAAGQYVVRVGASANAGEYVLAITGASGGLPAFRVLATTPANGAFVTAAPSTLTVVFNDLLLVTSVQNVDLLVDGVPNTSATGPVLTDGKTVVFTLPAGLGLGPHTVAFAAGALADVQGTPLAAYDGTFVVDATAPRVTASSVIENDLLAPGTWTYTATFDEDMDTTVLDATDFSLVGAMYGARTASSSVWSDARTLQLQYATLPEDNYTLTLRSATGRFQDRAGNTLDGEPHTPFSLPSGDGAAGGNFVVRFSVDLDAAAFPLPLAARNPLGSLVYGGATAGAVNAAGDSDRFTLALDAGQSLTVSLVPAAGLQPVLTVSDPTGGTLGTATAVAAGQQVVLQTLPVAAAGTYTLTVASSADTSGMYALQVELNAAVEAESYGGARNDDRASAQSLDSAFVALGTTGQRAAVLGGTDPRTTFLTWNMDADPGWTFQGQWAWGQPLGLWGDPAAGFTGSNVVGYNLGGAYADSMPVHYATTPAFSTLGKSAVQLSFRRWLGVEGSLSDRATIDVTRDGTTWTSVWVNSTSALMESAWSLQTYDISAVADNQPQVFLRFGMGPTNASVTLGGWNIDDVSLTAAGQIADHYSVTLAAGQAATIGVTSLAADTYTLGLYDAGGNLLAVGAGSTNVQRIISNFAAPAAGTYDIYVTGVSGAYNLVVTKDVGFDTEPNDSLAAAQDLAGTEGVLGFLSGSGDLGDYYRFPVNAGDVLTLSTVTPAGGPNEFANTLDPQLELYDPSGTLVASDDDGAADGRNALLNYTAAATGQYVVRVSAVGTGGEYLLIVPPTGDEDEIPPTVTVASLITNDTTPAITGSVSDGTLQVAVNGKTYTAGDGNLSVSGTNWTLQIPAGDALPLGTYNVTATATDAAGNVGTDSTADELQIVKLIVISLSPTSSGFVARFSGAFKLDGLNLYDGAGGALGAADVVLTDGGSQTVAGSLVVAADRQAIEFVATGGVLAPGTYTVTLKSGAAALRALDGEPLDGNRDGTPGDDFSGPLVVASSTGRTVSLPDFARGAGQAANVPATATGLPIRIDNADGVTSLAVDVVYDETLLAVAAAALAAGVPADWSVALDTATPSVAKITASGTTALSGTNVDVVRLSAAVPSDAAYGAVRAIRLENVSLNGGAIAAVGDTAVHKAVYLGDADGSGIHSSADAFLTVQAALGLASGFAAHAWADPRIVGDADGSGVLSAADAFLIVQEGLGLVEPFVPDNPHIGVTPVGGGVDPQFQIEVNIPASAGGLVTVPVQLDVEPAATNVGAFDFDLFFDPVQLTILLPDGVSAGADTVGWAVSAILVAPGQLRVGMVSSRCQPLAMGLREIAQLQFRVERRTGFQPVTDGLETRPTLLDLEAVDPRAGGYTWTGVDGSVSIVPALAVPAADGQLRSGAAAASETRTEPEPGACAGVSSTVMDSPRGHRPADAGPFAGLPTGKRARPRKVISTPQLDAERSDVEDVLSDIAPALALQWRR